MALAGQSGFAQKPRPGTRGVGPTFVDAVATAAKYTRPVAVAYRRWNGSLVSGAGAFVVLNDEGWIVTAAHIFNDVVRAQADKHAVEALQARIDRVAADDTMRPEMRARQLKRLRGEAKADWITHHAMWWAANGVTVADLTLVSEADIAVGRLDPYQPALDAVYPVIKNPGHMPTGRSLCRLGFPFHQVEATFDAATAEFGMNQEFTFFPLEGMATRTLESDTPAAGKYPLKYVETSSPGLMGQSGGPLFDAQARIWGIQSRTRHVPLGFKTVENQLINLGDAVHAETIAAILQDLGIKYELSPD